MATHDDIANARDDFMRGYVEAMLWANTYRERENGEYGSEPVDARYWYQSPGKWWQDTPVDIADAETFWDAFGYVIMALDYGKRGEEWSRAELAGHDFALTRNGHGAGFWDRGLGRIGDMLTKECEPYGEHNVILCVDEDDNVISAHNEN